jgi:hypothetical protein
MLGGLAVVSVTEPLALPWVALGTQFLQCHLRRP